MPDELHNRLGLAIGFHAYRAYRELLDSARMQRLMNEGARPQRLLWASTGTKDPDASDTLYIEGFASPFTVNTMPEPTLNAFADHGEVGELVPADGGDCDQVLAQFGERRDRRRRARQAAAGGGQGGLRQVLGRDAEDDRVAGRGTPVSEPNRRGDCLVFRGHVTRSGASEVSDAGAAPAARLAGAARSTSPRSRASTCATSSPPTRSAASG